MKCLLSIILFQTIVNLNDPINVNLKKYYIKKQLEYTTLMEILLKWFKY